MEFKDKVVSDEEMRIQEQYIKEVKNKVEAKAKLGVTMKVHFMTFGCQQNEADSERMAGLAVSMGYEITKTAEDASLIIVNTCAIREHAEKKTLSLVGQLKHLKQKDPELIIGICGCMVTQEHRKDEIKHRYPYVDFIIGTSSFYRIPEFVAKRMGGGHREFFTGEGFTEIPENMPVLRESNYRAWVSVMYGCNNFCSYCIVPYVRGRERSRRPDAVIEEVKGLVRDGYTDITLLGQNVNSYGRDCSFNCDFADLLYELDKIEGDYLLHFMTSHPKDASEKLIDVIAGSKHIAHQFHLPLQSGSDKILHAMNRHYDMERYLNIVEYMRKKIPDITITSDMIVGFPGETEEDFSDTLKVIEKVRFDMIYAFIFSPRKGTPAYSMEGQIDEKEKSSRHMRLTDAQNSVSVEKNRLLEGATLRVLCDGPSKNNENVYSGRTEGNKIVFFDGDEGLIGRFVNIKIERGETFALYGTIVK